MVTVALSRTENRTMARLMTLSVAAAHYAAMFDIDLHKHVELVGFKCIALSARAKIATAAA